MQDVVIVNAVNVLSKKIWSKEELFVSDDDFYFRPLFIKLALGF